jgi:hypothetical protein
MGPETVVVSVGNFDLKSVWETLFFDNLYIKVFLAKKRD